MRLRSREVVKREGKLVILHPPQIALDVLVRPEPRQEDARLGRAMRQDLRHLGHPTKSFRTGADLALKRMSRSPIVSARRRKLPQISARITRDADGPPR